MPIEEKDHTFAILSELSRTTSFCSYSGLRSLKRSVRITKVIEVLVLQFSARNKKVSLFTSINDCLQVKQRWARDFILKGWISTYMRYLTTTQWCPKLHQTKATTHMNILFPKLLIQTLRKRSQPKLPSRKRTRRRITPPSRRRTRKNQTSLLSFLIQL